MAAVSVSDPGCTATHSQRSAAGSKRTVATAGAELARRTVAVPGILGSEFVAKWNCASGLQPAGSGNGRLCVLSSVIATSAGCGNAPAANAIVTSELGDL